MTQKKKEMSLLHNLILVFAVIQITASSYIDCDGKSFHCVNATHFMICVDFGGGVTSTLDSFLIQCPPSTECRKTNKFECEFPSPVTPTVGVSVPSEIELVETATQVNSDTTRVLKNMTTSEASKVTSNVGAGSQLGTTETSHTTEIPENKIDSVGMNTSPWGFETPATDFVTVSTLQDPVTEKYIVSANVAIDSNNKKSVYVNNHLNILNVTSETITTDIILFTNDTSIGDNGINLLINSNVLTNNTTMYDRKLENVTVEHNSGPKNMSLSNNNYETVSPLSTVLTTETKISNINKHRSTNLEEKNSTISDFTLYNNSNILSVLNGQNMNKPTNIEDIILYNITISSDYYDLITYSNLSNTDPVSVNKGIMKITTFSKNNTNIEAITNNDTLVFVVSDNTMIAPISHVNSSVNSKIETPVTIVNPDINIEKHTTAVDELLLSDYVTEKYNNTHFVNKKLNKTVSKNDTNHLHNISQSLTTTNIINITDENIKTNTNMNPGNERNIIGDSNSAVDILVVRNMKLNISKVFEQSTDNSTNIVVKEILLPTVLITVNPTVKNNNTNRSVPLTDMIPIEKQAAINTADINRRKYNTADLNVEHKPYIEPLNTTEIYTNILKIPFNSKEIPKTSIEIPINLKVTELVDNGTIVISGTHIPSNDKISLTSNNVTIPTTNNNTYFIEAQQTKDNGNSSKAAPDIQIKELNLTSNVNNKQIGNSYKKNEWGKTSIPHDDNISVTDKRPFDEKYTSNSIPSVNNIYMTDKPPIDEKHLNNHSLLIDTTNKTTLIDKQELKTSFLNNSNYKISNHYVGPSKFIPSILNNSRTLNNSVDINDAEFINYDFIITTEKYMMTKDTLLVDNNSTSMATIIINNSTIQKKLNVANQNNITQPIYSESSSQIYFSTENTILQSNDSTSNNSYISIDNSSFDVNTLSEQINQLNISKVNMLINGDNVTNGMENISISAVINITDIFTIDNKDASVGPQASDINVLKLGEKPLSKTSVINSSKPDFGPSPHVINNTGTIITNLEIDVVKTYPGNTPETYTSIHLLSFEKDNVSEVIINNNGSLIQENVIVTGNSSDLYGLKNNETLVKTNVAHITKDIVMLKSNEAIVNNNGSVIKENIIVTENNGDFYDLNYNETSLNVTSIKKDIVIKSDDSKNKGFNSTATTDRNVESPKVQINKFNNSKVLVKLIEESNITRPLTKKELSDVAINTLRAINIKSNSQNIEDIVNNNGSFTSDDIIVTANNSNYYDLNINETSLKSNITYIKNDTVVKSDDSKNKEYNSTATSDLNVEIPKVQINKFNDSKYLVKLIDENNITHPLTKKELSNVAIDTSRAINIKSNRQNIEDIVNKNGSFTSDDMIVTANNSNFYDFNYNETSLKSNITYIKNDTVVKSDNSKNKEYNSTATSDRNVESPKVQINKFNNSKVLVKLIEESNITRPLTKKELSDVAIDTLRAINIKSNRQNTEDIDNNNRSFTSDDIMVTANISDFYDLNYETSLKSNITFIKNDIIVKSNDSKNKEYSSIATSDRNVERFEVQINKFNDSKVLIKFIDDNGNVTRLRTDQELPVVAIDTSRATLNLNINNNQQKIDTIKSLESEMYVYNISDMKVEPAIVNIPLKNNGIIVSEFDNRDAFVTSNNYAMPNSQLIADTKVVTERESIKNETYLTNNSNDAARDLKSINRNDFNRTYFTEAKIKLQSNDSKSNNDNSSFVMSVSNVEIVKSNIKQSNISNSNKQPISTVANASNAITLNRYDKGKSNSGTINVELDKQPVLTKTSIDAINSGAVKSDPNIYNTTVNRTSVDTGLKMSNDFLSSVHSSLNITTTKGVGENTLEKPHISKHTNITDSNSVGKVPLNSPMHLHSQITKSEIRSNVYESTQVFPKSINGNKTIAIYDIDKTNNNISLHLMNKEITSSVQLQHNSVFNVNKNISTLHSPIIKPDINSDTQDKSKDSNTPLQIKNKSINVNITIESSNVTFSTRKKATDTNKFVTLRYEENNMQKVEIAIPKLKDIKNFETNNSVVAVVETLKHLNSTMTIATEKSTLAQDNVVVVNITQQNSNDSMRTGGMIKHNLVNTHQKPVPIDVKTSNTIKFNDTNSSDLFNVSIPASNVVTGVGQNQPNITESAAGLYHQNNVARNLTSILVTENDSVKYKNIRKSAHTVANQSILLSGSGSLDSNGLATNTAQSTLGNIVMRKNISDHILSPKKDNTSDNATRANETFASYNISNHVATKEKQLEFNCINRKRGRYSDKIDCGIYYICIGRLQPIIGKCPIGTVFSDITKQCTKNVTHCSNGREFQCTSGGRFSDFTSENTYYICVPYGKSYARFKFQCQGGYYLDKKAVKCNKILDLESQNQSTSVSIDSKSEHTVNEEADDGDVNTSGTQFKCDKEGVFADDSDCRIYYVCTKNKKSEFRRRKKKCDSDELFHKDKKKCVDDDSYDC